jgi:heme exporter protein A
MPTLSVNRVGHYFGSLLLFRRVSFALEGGTSLAVTGANGAGKSTLLRILAGLMSPKAGDVALSVRGSPVADRSLQTGLVAPALDVYDDLTARENLRFLASARRMTERPDRIGAVLKQVGLADRADDPVATYSSGMRQRVKYAAALLAEPPLLLLDEPSANLDAPGRQMVDRIIEAQQTRDGLLVVATNRADEAARHDRSLRIEDHR